MSRVLVIDDDHALRSDIVLQLSAWGYETAEAVDGVAGLQAIHEWLPDIVLSDIQMPNMSGLDLIDAVSAAGLEQASIGFFFITSLASRQSLLSGYGVGADEYLIKPIDYEMLQLRLAGFLRKRDAISTRTADNSAFASASSAAIAWTSFLLLVTVAGIICFLVLYSVKSTLGYDLMPDAHLFDFLFGSR